MPVSEDVLRLVRTVERLPSEDQDKILRMVDLLTLVPLPVQHRTQRMLRELLERQPNTKSECVAGVDDVLAYLERNAAAAARRRREPVTRIEFAALDQDPVCLEPRYLAVSWTAPVHVAGGSARYARAVSARSNGSGRRRGKRAASAANRSCASCHAPRPKRSQARAANAARPSSSSEHAAPSIGSSTRTGKRLPRNRNVPTSRAGSSTLLQRRRRNQHARSERLVQALNSRSSVHDVADGAILVALLGADVAEQQLAGFEADPRRQRRRRRACD